MCKNFIVAVIYMSASKWLLLINDVECHFHVIRSNILQYYWPRRNTQSYDVKYACAIAIEGLDIRFEETISNEDCLQGSSTIKRVGEFQMCHLIYKGRLALCPPAPCPFHHNWNFIDDNEQIRINQTTLFFSSHVKFDNNNQPCNFNQS